MNEIEKVEEFIRKNVKAAISAGWTITCKGFMNRNNKCCCILSSCLIDDISADGSYIDYFCTESGVSSYDAWEIVAGFDGNSPESHRNDEYFQLGKKFREEFIQRS